ncbi:MAG TPA: SRPBCC domain-containing protein [Myxococcaceae bacterium]|nr:SRPBCC domain-containing protein [Myxococcaceae bacterium]
MPQPQRRRPSPSSGCSRRARRRSGRCGPRRRAWSAGGGPEGFSVRVHRLDLRVGGRLELVMGTEVPEIVAMLKASGVSPSNALVCTYTEVEPNHRLVYQNLVDFVPGVPPYTATTRVELTPVPGGTRLAVTNDVMHSAEWTERARMGWEQEIGKLERALG